MFFLLRFELFLPWEAAFDGLVIRKVLSVAFFG